MAKEKVCGIYKIENLVNSKVYIGQSKDINMRFLGHKSVLRRNKHGNEYLQRAWNKYGEDKFIFEILEECLLNDLDLNEIKWINKYNTLDTNFGYNIESGGNKLKTLSEKTKKKISENHADVSGENNPFYGKKHDQETLKRIHSNGNRIKSITAENNFHTKLTNDEVLSIKDKIRNGESAVDIASLFNISKYNIYDIANNKSWTSIGGLIELPETLKQQYKFNHANKQIDEQTAKNIIELLIQGIGNKEISEELNIKLSIIEGIRYKKIWRHLTNDIIFPSVKNNRAKGSKNGNSVLNENQVILIKQRLRDGWRICEISKDMNIHKDLICNIKTGKTWKHIEIEKMGKLYC